MPNIPRDLFPDSTLFLLRDGYAFVQQRRRRYQSDIFQTRIMLEKAICIGGAEAAKLFYNPELFIRNGAVPWRIQKTLQGIGGVQGLDGDVHKQRKALFMSVMTPEAIGLLMQHLARQWQIAILRWLKKDRITLFEEAQEIFCRAACAWADVPMYEADASRAEDLGAMVDGFGGIGPRYWRARRARLRSEEWICGLIKQVRRRPPTQQPTILESFAWYREPNGRQLETRVAAVEVLNLLRPIAAIATYVTFAALALHSYPDCRRALLEKGDEYLEWFVQEVRRFYPFTPFVGARVRAPFEWKGYRFEPGTLVILDVYGTNHDPQLWEEPEVFRPERFRNWSGSAFDLIPQGGGDHFTGHRCAGEWITIAAMKQAVDTLVRTIAYEVPQQDLSFSLSRIPTRPRSGFVMSGVMAAN
jgi:fatty-acid peroxygenase